MGGNQMIIATGAMLALWSVYMIGEHRGYTISEKQNKAVREGIEQAFRGGKKREQN
jgi:hypothetical protein